MLYHASHAYGCADLSLSVVGPQKRQVNERCFGHLNVAYEKLRHNIKSPNLPSRDLVIIGLTIYMLLSYAVSSLLDLFGFC